MGILRCQRKATGPPLLSHIPPSPFAEKEEFPLTNDSPLDIRSRIRDWSLLRALERAALVSVRLLLGEPSNLRWRVSS